MFWFVLGAIGFGALCALGGSSRRTVVNNYYTNDGYVETDGGGSCNNSCDSGSRDDG
jgi:hypothetical protein